MRRWRHMNEMARRFNHECNVAILKAVAKTSAFVAILFLVTFAVMNLA